MKFLVHVEQQLQHCNVRNKRKKKKPGGSNLHVTLHVTNFYCSIIPKGACARKFKSRAPSNFSHICTRKRNNNQREAKLFLGKERAEWTKSNQHSWPRTQRGEIPGLGGGLAEEDIGWNLFNLNWNTLIKELHCF